MTIYIGASWDNFSRRKSCSRNFCWKWKTKVKNKQRNYPGIRNLERLLIHAVKHSEHESQYLTENQRLKWEGGGVRSLAIIQGSRDQIPPKPGKGRLKRNETTTFRCVARSNGPLVDPKKIFGGGHLN